MDTTFDIKQMETTVSIVVTKPEVKVDVKDDTFTEVKKKSTRGRKPKDATQTSSSKVKKEKEFKTQKMDDTKMDSLLKVTAGQKLLANKEVIRWLYGDLSFLPKQTQKEENDWGMKFIKSVIPDLKSKKQWTNAFGEAIVKELATLIKETAKKPEPKNHLQPDFELSDTVIEVKCGTFFTNGTAHEKIMGCAIKYAEVPKLYGKELAILCVGNAEKLARDTYQILKTSQNVPEEKTKILKCYKELNIRFYGITEALDSFLTE
jgi:hypothetical protein